MKLMSMMDALGTGALAAMSIMVAAGFAHTQPPPIVAPTLLPTKDNTTMATKKTTKMRISTQLKSLT